MECFSPQDVKALIEKVGIPIEDSEKTINALVSQLNSILERFRSGRRETRAEMMEKLRESERILKRARKLIDPDRNLALVIAGYFYAKKHRKQHPGFPIQGIIEVDPETGKKTLQRGTLYRSLYRVEQLISHVDEVLDWIKDFDAPKGRARSAELWLIGKELPQLFEWIFDRPFPNSSTGPGSRFVIAVLSKAGITLRPGTIRVYRKRMLKQHPGKITHTYD
jgi:hypothetical protein